ncbi:phage portal protein [Lysinibacillus xylanilyticus]|uniref:phage portal protein n=1 Tax=Lysinibacillus xylanilyticus TaxID=582475 RepID=UPI003823891A
MQNETIRKRMQRFRPYIKYFQEHSIKSDIIAQLISEHKSIHDDVVKLQQRYETSKDGVPILKRTPNPMHFMENERMRRVDALVNNKLNNAIDADFVDTKIGYFLGNPISYVVEARKEPRLQLLADEVEAFRTRNNVPDKDTTAGKQTDIAGYSARLVYFTTENDKLVLKIANIEPQGCIFFYEESMSEPTFALQYYPSVVIDAQGNKQSVTEVEFHDNTHTYFFRSGTSGYELYDTILHGLDGCPLFGIENNDELQGAAIRILNLIDAYDRTMSDANSEIESTRLAILLLRNLGMDEEDIQELHKSGALEMWGDNTDIKYLTKDVNDTMIENHLNRLEANMHKFAKSVDFSDEAFAGNISGVAMKFKTMALEHKAIIAEHKMRSALQYQFKLLCSGWAKLGICEPEDYLKVWFGFKRNLPVNVLEESQATVNLKGNVSERTRLSLLSFVDDVDAELEEMQKDAKLYGNELEPLDAGNDEDEDIDPEEVDET